MTTELDLQYSPSSRVPSLQLYLDQYAELSAAVRADHEVRTLEYGPHPDQTLDFFPGEPGGPLQVFVHGGNWQALTKDDSAFAAPGFLRAGAAFAAVNYPLAPAYALDEIVAAVRRCVRWLCSQAHQLGFDPDRLHLSGTSAGAHLAAMAMIDDVGDRIAGVTLLSGMYDLEPVRRSYVNEALRMDFAAAHRNSPVWWLPARLPPVIVAMGDNETDEYRRQHELMVAALRLRTSVVDLVVTGRNHFDLPYDLTDGDTELGRAVLTQLKERAT